MAHGVFFSLLNECAKIDVKFSKRQILRNSRENNARVVYIRLVTI